MCAGIYQTIGILVKTYSSATLLASVLGCTEMRLRLVESGALVQVAHAIRTGDDLSCGVVLANILHSAVSLLVYVSTFVSFLQACKKIPQSMLHGFSQHWYK